MEIIEHCAPCENCKIFDCFEPLCPACKYLATVGRVRMWGETEGLVNRRWQMRFTFGLLPDEKGDGWGGIKWERKKKFQDW